MVVVAVVMVMLFLLLAEEQILIFLVKSSITSGDWAVVVVLVEVLAVSFSARFSARMYWCTKS